MPRPAPKPENSKRRTTISLTRQTYDMANAYLEKHANGERIKDFSDLVARALEKYAEGKEPGLLNEIREKIQVESGNVRAGGRRIDRPESGGQAKKAG